MLEPPSATPVAVDGETPLSRGDLVFWKGHVGIMRDARTLLHANGWHMKVVSEPLARGARPHSRERRRGGDGREEIGGRRRAR